MIRRAILCALPLAACAPHVEQCLLSPVPSACVAQGGGSIRFSGDVSPKPDPAPEPSPEPAPGPPAPSPDPQPEHDHDHDKEDDNDRRGDRHKQAEWEYD